MPCKKKARIHLSVEWVASLFLGCEDQDSNLGRRRDCLVDDLRNVSQPFQVN
jgi:hypothetical protein